MKNGRIQNHAAEMENKITNSSTEAQEKNKDTRKSGAGGASARVPSSFTRIGYRAAHKSFASLAFCTYQ